MTKAVRGEIDFTVGSGNVFRDLGLDSPDEELSKAGLALQIHDRVKALGLNATQAALRLGIPSPRHHDCSVATRTDFPRKNFLRS